MPPYPYSSLAFAVIRFDKRRLFELQLKDGLTAKITAVGDLALATMDFWDAQGNNVQKPDGVTLFGPFGGVVPLKHGQYRLAWRDKYKLSIEGGNTYLFTPPYESWVYITKA